MANDFVLDLEKIHNKLKQTIRTAQHCYQTAVDRKCSPDPKIQVGDQVFILAKFIRTTRPSKKLAECYLGLFKVLGKPGTHSYLIKLPNHLRTIHPVFHVSQLEPVHSSRIPNRSNTPLPPIEVDGHLEFEIAQILDAKLDQRRKDPLMYLIQWAGYEESAKEHSWVPAADLVNAVELIDNFHHQYPEKLGPRSTIDPGILWRRSEASSVGNC